MYARSPSQPIDRLNRVSRELACNIRARRPSLHDSTDDKKHLVTSGQAAGKDARKLFYADAGLDKIGQLIDGRTTFTRIEGEAACVSAVTNELGRDKWVHFARHGVPNQEELSESACARHDGKFTISFNAMCGIQSLRTCLLVIRRLETKRVRTRLYISHLQCNLLDFPSSGRCGEWMILRQTRSYLHFIS